MQKKKILPTYLPYFFQTVTGNKQLLFLGLMQWGYFHPKHKDATIFENHLNPVMLVSIG